MSSIEGIPEGWELVRVEKILAGEFFIDSDGIAHKARGNVDFHGNIVIRKIERPKQYRPFENKAEYMPHWNKPVVIDLSDDPTYWFSSVYSVTPTKFYVAVGDGIYIYTYQEAFEKLKFADGSPFGVEVTS